MGTPLDPSKVKAEAADRLAAEVAEFLTTAMAKANPNLPVLRKMRTALADYQPAPEPEPEESEFKRGFKNGYQLGYKNGQHEATAASDEADETSEDAPEPEPEWEPGSVGRIEVFGDTELHAMAGLVRGDWHAEDGLTYREPNGEVTHVHTLVVIDPATVDVTALGDTFDAAYQETSGYGYPTQSRTNIALRAVLSALKIEAP